MVAIHPKTIVGHWTAGVALDDHTVSSIPTGPDAEGRMHFDTTRTEIGDLLYQLKYRGNVGAAQGVISAATQFLRAHRSKLDIIVPVPPSAQRIFQPVIILARGIGMALGLPVIDCIGTTRPTPQLKDVVDPKSRQALVLGLYSVDPRQTTAKNVLLFDDLYRSGTTMNAITDVLLQQGRAASVRALTITRTRSNQ